MLAQQTPTKVPVESLSDTQIREFVEKARKSGLTEVEIEKAALLQGFSAADISKLRQRINQLPSQNSKGDSSKMLNTSRVQATDAEKNKPESAITQASVAKKTEIFGASLFNNKSLTFEPDLRIPTPKNYVLGPDDELIVDITGYSQVTYRPKVSPEGSIRLENLSPIFVNGLTIEQATDRIVNRLRQLYQGLNIPGGGTYAQVTLGSVRSIKVTITGEVEKPGTYTISSLATAFNALYESGGPTANGSFRNIKIIRANKTVRTIDLYDFVLRADQKDNVRLFDQDIIFVSDYETKIELIGEVKRPGVYEVRKGETLRTVLGFAGGFSDQAYTETITLRRNTPKELKISNIDQKELDNFVPQSGDRYAVGAILNRYENRVEILGAVFRPGEYAIEEGTKTVRELIGRAEGLREDAFRNRATIRREHENLDAEVIAFDLGKLIKGEIGDILLKRQDVVIIKSLTELRENRSVNIVGAVNKAGNFDFAENMNIADLVVLAGGFTEAATPNRVEVSRRMKEDSSVNQNVQIFSFNLDKNLSFNDLDAKFLLKPFDIIYVRDSPNYEKQQEVIISGEVKYPGKYAIKDRSERITDLINRAGDLKSTAFLPGARFFRKGKVIAIDISSVIQNPAIESNLLVENGDSVVIPKPIETVSMAGAVLNPMTTNYESRFRFEDYLARAGGFEEKALRRKTFVTYPNGTIDRTRKFLFFNKYPKIVPGTTITVPFQSEKESGKMSTSEKVAIISAITSVLITTTALINLLSK